MIIWETLEDMKIVSRKSVWLHLALESFRHLGIFPFDVGVFKKYRISKSRLQFFDIIYGLVGADDVKI